MNYSILQLNSYLKNDSTAESYLDCILLLLQAGSVVQNEPVCRLHQQTLLLLAATHGCREVIDELFEGSSNGNIRIDYFDDTQTTPLLAAIQNDHYPTAQLILARGANPFIRDISGATALSMAINHLDIADEGARVELESLVISLLQSFSGIGQVFTAGQVKLLEECLQHQEGVTIYPEVFIGAKYLDKYDRVSLLGENITQDSIPSLSSCLSNKIPDINLVQHAANQFLAEIVTSTKSKDIEFPEILSPDLSTVEKIVIEILANKLAISQSTSPATQRSLNAVMRKLQSRFSELTLRSRLLPVTCMVLCGCVFPGIGISLVYTSLYTKWRGLISVCSIVAGLCMARCGLGWLGDGNYHSWFNSCTTDITDFEDWRARLLNTLQSLKEYLAVLSPEHITIISELEYGLERTSSARQLMRCITRLQLTLGEVINSLPENETLPDLARSLLQQHDQNQGDGGVLEHIAINMDVADTDNNLESSIVLSDINLSPRMFPNQMQPATLNSTDSKDLLVKLVLNGCYLTVKLILRGDEDLEADQDLLNYLLYIMMDRYVETTNQQKLEDYSDTIVTLFDCGAAYARTVKKKGLLHFLVEHNQSAVLKKFLFGVRSNDELVFVQGSSTKRETWQKQDLDSGARIFELFYQHTTSHWYFKGKNVIGETVQNLPLRTATLLEELCQVDDDNFETITQDETFQQQLINSMLQELGFAHPTACFDLDSKNDKGVTALYRAIQKKHYQLAMDLLGAGANPYIPNRSQGLTPLRCLLKQAYSFFGTHLDRNRLIVRMLQLNALWYECLSESQWENLIRAFDRHMETPNHLDPRGCICFNMRITAGDGQMVALPVFLQTNHLENDFLQRTLAEFPNEFRDDLDAWMLSLDDGIESRVRQTIIHLKYAQPYNANIVQDDPIIIRYGNVRVPSLKELCMQAMMKVDNATTHAEILKTLGFSDAINEIRHKDYAAFNNTVNGLGTRTNQDIVRLQGRIDKKARSVSDTLRVGLAGPGAIVFCFTFLAIVLLARFDRHNESSTLSDFLSIIGGISGVMLLSLFVPFHIGVGYYVNINYDVILDELKHDLDQLLKNKRFLSPEQQQTLDELIQNSESVNHVKQVKTLLEKTALFCTELIDTLPQNPVTGALADTDNQRNSTSLPVPVSVLPTLLSNNHHSGALVVNRNYDNDTGAGVGDTRTRGNDESDYSDDASNLQLFG